MTQPRDRQINAPGPGIPAPAPVAITGAGALAAALAVGGAADRISLRAHQRLSERLDHRPEKIRARLSRLLVQPARHVDTGWHGHRVGSSSSRSFAGTQMRITRWPSHITTPRLPAGTSNTTSVDATLN